MGKIRKKGQHGAAVDYITRTRAVRKLQVDIGDFRRLCILKGIYPREPRHKKKVAGKGSAFNTFYYVKDINYLLHEPVLKKMREQKSFAKKLARAIGKGQVNTVKTMESNQPIYSLDHLVKERYPTFMDAIRDLDDCLCHMFLFAALPSDDNIQSKEVKESKRLGCEFENYVISSKSLRKVFLSIRGIYYQAEIKGELITWLVPYQFLQNVPIGVDFRVMLTFLEFYQTLLGFVNFKLYSELNLKYPPMSHQQLEDDGADLLTSFKAESTNSENASTLTSSPNLVPATKLSKLERKTLQQRIHTLNDKLSAIKEDALIEDASSAPHSEETELVVEEEGIATVVDVFEENLDKNVQSTHEKILSQISEKENLTAFQNLFATSVIFLSREVPHHALTFCIQSFGGLMAWSETSGAGSPFKESDAAITHQIVDKPLESLSMIAGRVYIQPQWIFDSINKRQLQPAHLYAPGSILPSHLSPFASYAEDDYVPEEENIEVETDNQLVDEPTEEDPQVNQAELEAEAAGTPFSQYKPILSEESKKAKILTTNGPAVTKRRHRQKELEKIEMHRGLLSNKKRRVVDAFIAEKRGKIREADQLQERKNRSKSTTATTDS